MIIENISIHPDYRENRFIKSLKLQSKSKKLSQKQIKTLKDVINLDEDIIPYDMLIINVYSERFYRTDSNGDYLCDHRTAYAISECDKGTNKYEIFENEVESIDLSEKVQDLHALQYNSVRYEERYIFKKTIEIPRLDFSLYFLGNIFKYYSKLSDLLSNNKFRLASRKFKARRLMNTLTQAKKWDDIDIEELKKFLRI